MANDFYKCKSCSFFKENICTNDKSNLPERMVTPAAVCDEYEERPELVKAKHEALKELYPNAVIIKSASYLKKTYPAGREFFVYLGGEFLKLQVPIKEQMRIRSTNP